MAIPRMKSRVTEYSTSASAIGTRLSSTPGQAMSWVNAPKCAIIWSARMIAIAIVISA